MARKDHQPDLTRIKGALQEEIDAKLMAAKIEEEEGRLHEAERLRGIATQWQHVHDGTT